MHKSRESFDRQQAAQMGHDQPVSSRFWSNEEKKAVVSISVKEWDWVFPGWKWVSIRLNKEFKNNRTPEACRKMAAKLGLNGC